MKYKRIDPVIRKEKFVLITSVELDQFMQINHFSDEDQGWIKEAKDKFSKASIILYFLNRNYNGYYLDSFLPIYNTQIELNNAPNIRKIGTALCIIPIILELAVRSWHRDDVEHHVIDWRFNKDNWQGEYGFGLQEDGNMAAEMDINPSAGVPVTQGHIDFMKTQLNAYQIKASIRPEFMPYVNEIAEKIEEMQRELDSIPDNKTTTVMSETKVPVPAEQDESTPRRTILGRMQNQDLPQTLRKRKEYIGDIQRKQLERTSRIYRIQQETISGTYWIKRILPDSNMRPAFLDIVDVETKELITGVLIPDEYRSPLLYKELKIDWDKGIKLQLKFVNQKPILCGILKTSVL